MAHLALLFDRYDVCAGIADQTTSGPGVGLGLIVGFD